MVRIFVFMSVGFLLGCQANRQADIMCTMEYMLPYHLAESNEFTDVKKSDHFVLDSPALESEVNFPYSGTEQKKMFFGFPTESFEPSAKIRYDTETQALRLSVSHQPDFPDIWRLRFTLTQVRSHIGGDTVIHETDLDFKEVTHKPRCK